MSNLRIYVNVTTDGTATYSGFGVGDDKHVFFYNNHATDTLTVVIKDATAQSSPLCENNSKGPKVTAFPVDHGQFEKFAVCEDFTGASFKYTATIGNAAPEDPIVIVEKSGIIGGPGTSHKLELGLALLAGAAAVLIFQAFLRMRSRGPT